MLAKYYILLFLFLSLLVGGCVNTQVSTLTSMELPEPKLAPCCGQIIQSIVIERSGKQFQSLGVTAFEEDRYSLVLLDPAGRRVLSMVQNKATNSPVVVWQAPEIVDKFPLQFLWKIFHLTWWPNSSWNNSSLSEYFWSVDYLTDTRSIVNQVKYKDRTVLNIEYISVGSTNNEDDVKKVFGDVSQLTIGDTFSIRHSKIPFTMIITVKGIQPL